MKSARVYGLGLMGTNLGLKLLSKGVTVYGEDVDKESLDRASSLGINTSDTSEVVDLTILAIPINSIISTLSSETLMTNTKAIVDIGGTKKKICNLMDIYKVPSIGGHPAFTINDLSNLTARLDKEKILYSDAKVYAMPGFHQIYLYDINANMLEINQAV